MGLGVMLLLRIWRRFSVLYCRFINLVLLLDLARQVLVRSFLFKLLACQAGSVSPAVTGAYFYIFRVKKTVTTTAYISNVTG